MQTQQHYIKKLLCTYAVFSNLFKAAHDTNIGMENVFVTTEYVACETLGQ